MSASSEDGKPFRFFQIGDLEVWLLSDGHSDRPVSEGTVPNASVADVRSALRAAGLPDSIHRSHFSAVAVRRGSRLTLIDTGTGGFSVYGQNCGTLRESMSDAGLDARDIGTVLLTHLHGDHIYGLMDETTGAPKSPDAEIAVPATELAWWTRPD